MPLGAILYVQVPDSTTSEDWERWRDAFIASFDFGLDGWNEEFQKSVEAELLMPDWANALQYPSLGGHEKDISVWEAFPNSTFLEVDLPRYTHYGPGYERGHLPEFIQHAEWFEGNIPNCRVWYADDCSNTAMVYDASVREILLEYYGRVGDEPYRVRENRERWTEVQAECWRLWMQEQERVLQEVRGARALNIDENPETAS